MENSSMVTYFEIALNATEPHKWEINIGLGNGLMPRVLIYFIMYH